MNTAETPAGSSPMSRRTLLAVGCGVFGVLLVALLILLVVRGPSDGDIAGSTSAAGVDLGGLDRDAAVSRLREQLGDRADDPITVSVGDRREIVDPVAAGLSFDAAATVDEALNRSRDGREVAPVVAVDQAKMAATVTDLAKKLNRQAKEGGITFPKGVPTAVTPRTGITIDQDEVSGALQAGYLREGTVSLPAAVKEPKVSADTVARALDEVAKPAVAAPLTVADGDRQVRLTGAELAAFLSFEPTAAGNLELRVDGKKLADDVDENLGTSQERPADASFAIVNGVPEVVPAKSGRAIDAGALQRTVLEMLPNAAPRTVQVLRSDAQPEFTTDEARAMGIKEQLSSYTQKFPYAAYRVQNIGTAARYLNGTLLAPGETFSLNKIIKERTEANGYTVGTIIDSGRFKKELGGGVSTVATTTWNNAFFAGLERVEQRAHSLYISRYKAGLEATVSYGSLDLKFKNDSPNGVFITAESGNSSVTISFWGTKRYDVTAEPAPATGRSPAEVPGRYNVRKPETIYDNTKAKKGDAACEPQSGVEGFDVDVNRVFHPVGSLQVLKTEKLTTKYEATNQVICGAKPTAVQTVPPDDGR